MLLIFLLITFQKIQEKLISLLIHEIIITIKQIMKEETIKIIKAIITISRQELIIKKISPIHSKLEMFKSLIRRKYPNLKKKIPINLKAVTLTIKIQV